MRRVWKEDCSSYEVFYNYDDAGDIDILEALVQGFERESRNLSQPDSKKVQSTGHKRGVNVRDIFYKQNGIF